MLGKLLKYEFKSTSRIMWMLYGALIIVALLLGIVLRFNIDFSGFEYDMPEVGNTFVRILSAALIFIYVMLGYGVVIMTAVMIVTRFYKNLLGGEGYLMHTLPVKTHNLILSKGIVAIAWLIIGGVAGLLSGLVLGLVSGFIPYILKQVTWDEFWSAVSKVLSTDTFWLLILFSVVSVLSTILTYYVSMAIGNLANKNKILFAVLAYLAIGIVISILTSIIGIGTGTLWEYLTSTKFFNRFLILQTVIQAIMGIGFFFGTNYILKNKLNLQ